MIKNKDFIILFLGRLITNFGDSIYLIATMLLVFSLSGSTFYTGLALFLTSSTAIVQIILSPILNRINMKKFLIVTQIIQGVLLLFIPYLHITGNLKVYHVLIIMPIISFLNQLVYPGQLALLPKIVDSKDLVKANSLFGIAYQGSDAIFNFLGGIIITTFGFIWAYYIDSITFFINAILFLFLSKVVSTPCSNEKSKKDSIKNYFSELKEGIIFWKNSPLKSLVFGVIFINLAATAIYAALPEFSRTSTYYGILLSASGIGVLLGSMLSNLEILKSIKLGFLYVMFILIISLCWMGMIFINNDSLISKLIVFALFFIGWVLIGILNIYSQTVIQMSTPRDKVTIVLSAMLGLSTALSPLGALGTSFMSRYYDNKVVIFSATFLILIIGIYWLFNESIKNIESLKRIGGENYE